MPRRICPVWPLTSVIIHETPGLKVYLNTWCSDDGSAPIKTIEINQIEPKQLLATDIKSLVAVLDAHSTDLSDEGKFWGDIFYEYSFRVPSSERETEPPEAPKHSRDLTDKHDMTELLKDVATRPSPPPRLCNLVKPLNVNPGGVDFGVVCDLPITHVGPHSWEKPA